MRIPLRHYRPFTRSPYLDVADGQLSARLPSMFGGRARFTVPLSELGVVDRHSTAIDDSGDGWTFVREPYLPYLATTTSNAAWNLGLVFASPQRVPPVSVAGGLGSPLSFFASRRPGGQLLDGMKLRAVDPDAAARDLIAEGAQRVERPVAWLRDRRETTHDPMAVAADATLSKRRRVMLGLVFAALIVLQSLRILAHWVSLTIVLGIGGAALVVLCACLLLVGRARRQRERQMQAATSHRPPPNLDARRSS